MRDILDICGDLPVETFQTGDVLMEEDVVADRLYILIEGEATVRKGGTEVTRVREPGAVFGEISALLAVSTTAEVAAATPVKAYRVERAGEYLKNNPELALHTARILARRLVDATSYLTDMRRQFEGYTNHFGMVDQVLDTLMQQQERWPDVRPEPKPGDERL
ncbi:Crp/Fnr family transcriptional regulator [Ovoidimarina sediminis]|uniref:Crp/Fnr family transcriptional regulator n=1 Tax=Ovoidimarina sediminis TaxID=3079856 RepID=UPI00290DDF14|nr:cyclic nucleotide-binding domain-containing protein [Rhodophyticola sp. MJ-SS7]MDU8943936.1 cyclic nucleotide-binding domain-containing protein [Rhodophyticola sp. MJ-SS7]